MTGKHDTSNWFNEFRNREEKAGGLLPYFVQETMAYFPYIQMIRRYAKEGDKLLEIGFGTAFTSIYLSSFDYDIYALDINPKVIEYGVINNNSLGGKCKFIRGGMFDLPFKNDSFSIIYHYGVMEHYTEEDIVKSLREQIRVSSKIIFGIPTKI